MSHDDIIKLEKQISAQQETLTAFMSNVSQIGRQRETTNPIHHQGNRLRVNSDEFFNKANDNSYRISNIMVDTCDTHDTDCHMKIQ